MVVSTFLSADVVMERDLPELLLQMSLLMFMAYNPGFEE